MHAMQSRFRVQGNSSRRRACEGTGEQSTYWKRYGLNEDSQIPIGSDRLESPVLRRSQAKDKANPIAQASSVAAERPKGPPRFQVKRKQGAGCASIALTFCYRPSDVCGTPKDKKKTHQWHMAGFEFQFSAGGMPKQET